MNQTVIEDPSSAWNWAMFAGDAVGAGLPIVPAPGTIMRAARSLSKWVEAPEATLRVIGHIEDGYASVGKAMGAIVFDVKTEVFNSWTAAEKWAHNKEFLDIGIAEHARFMNISKRVRPGSMLEREIDYLLEHGYIWDEAGTALVPRR